MERNAGARRAACKVRPRGRDAGSNEWSRRSRPPPWRGALWSVPRSLPLLDSVPWYGVHATLAVRILEESQLAALNAKGSLVAGVLAAIGASVCCVVPLVLLALGIGGAWVGNLTAFEPYRPLFIGLTLLFL